MSYSHSCRLQMNFAREAESRTEPIDCGGMKVMFTDKSKGFYNVLVIGWELSDTSSQVRMDDWRNLLGKVCICD